MEFSSREIFDALRALGYDCGDEAMQDDRSAWAIRWFRRRNGLKDADAIDQAMADRLFGGEAARATDAFQYYSMKDPLWAQHPYKAANTQENEVVGNSGCGPTCMAMALSTLLGRAILPPTLADWSNSRGYRDPDGIHGTSDRFFFAAAEANGLRAEMKPLKERKDYEGIEKAISDGKIVICNVVPGSPFTRFGHYNLIREIDDGRVRICDPVPKNMDLPAWTLDEWAEGNWARHFIAIGK